MESWLKGALVWDFAKFAKAFARTCALVVFLNLLGGSIAPYGTVANATLIGGSDTSGTRLAQVERTDLKTGETFDLLAGSVRERARTVSNGTARTALQALAASLGGGCVQGRGSRPGIAVLGFPNIDDVGLSNTEATALRDEVKDAISRFDDLIVWVPIDDSASTHDVLETIRVTGNAEASADARRALDSQLKSAVDYVIHFSKVVTTSNESSFQINVLSRDGGCAQSRMVPIAPERLVSGDLRVIIQDAARAASRSLLVGAMGSGDALVVIPPLVDRRVLSSLWADTFANDLARAVKTEATSRHPHIQPELIGVYGDMPNGISPRFLWLQPRFDLHEGKVRFRLELFATEGDPMTIHEQAVARMVVPPEAWSSPVLELVPAHIPFIKKRAEYDFLVTSASTLSLFCHFITPSNSSTLLMPRLGRNGLESDVDIDSLNEVWRPSPALARKSLHDLADRSFLIAQPEIRLDLIECVGVPALPPESREALTIVTRSWLKMASRKKEFPAADEVRALFTNLPLYHHGWVARAIGRVVETTRVPDRERANPSNPLVR